MVKPKAEGPSPVKTFPSLKEPMFTQDQEESSPFAGATKHCRLSGSQLESYLRAEVQYLKRRKLIPRTTGTSSSNKAEPAGSKDISSSSANYRRGDGSPLSVHSGSDSEGENSGPSSSQQKSGGSKPYNMSQLYEKPQFSLKQVKMICERLLNEQEVRLRFEYECALVKKLEEQHDQYVQYIKEQGNSRSNTADLSYVS